MSAEMRRALQSRGGKGVAPANRAFAKDRALASAAGRKGGKARQHGNKRPEAPPHTAPNRS
jgi:general stress protein YciG